MKNDLFYLLKCFSGLFLGLGTFQYLDSIFVFELTSFHPGIILAGLVIVYLIIVFKVFQGKRKFEVPSLILMLWFGVTASSFFGGLAARRHFEERAYISTTALLDEVEKARVCNSTSDCIILGSFCGVGCHIAVNKVTKDDILELLNKIEPCKLRCSPTTPVECERGRCVRWNKEGFRK